MYSKEEVNELFALENQALLDNDSEAIDECGDAIYGAIEDDFNELKEKFIELGHELHRMMCRYGSDYIDTSDQCDYMYRLLHVTYAEAYDYWMCKTDVNPEEE